MGLLRVEFGKPEHGWMAVALTSGDTRFDVHASYTPRDSVSDLASAASLILKGGVEATLVWNEEPNQVDFHFTAEGDEAMLVATRYPDHQRGKRCGQELLRVRGTRADVCLPFWRGLRQLQSKMPSDEYKAAWRHEFPGEKVDEISALAHRGQEKARQ
jgi:hypothetical protein